ncbi:MAG: hypothetical protein K1X28_08960 [Parachlamydiales bacterium]|nr:hypothetical protein [Parachlamydiales bacterium]
MNALQPYNPNEQIPKAVSSETYTCQFDRLISPILDRVSRMNVDRRLIISDDYNQNVSLSGRDIQALLMRVREAIPEIVALSPDERPFHEIQANLDGKKFTVLAGAIPKQLKNLYQQFEIDQNALESAIDGDYADISMAAVQEYSRARPEKREWYSKQLNALVFDPGNPEKGKKYVYSLYSIREALNRDFPKWDRLLMKLEGFVEKDRFVKHAYYTLNALHQNFGSDEDIRAQYAFILQNLREALRLVPTTDLNVPEISQAFRLLCHMCHAKFTMVHMYPWLEDMVSKALRAPQLQGPYEFPEFSLKAFAEDLHNANERLHKVPPDYQQQYIAMQLKKLQGTLGCGFDPNGDSNTPWVHSVQTSKGKKLCTVLRHGTPTMDPSVLGAAVRLISAARSTDVIPEYRAHLAAYPMKQTLYVNHQGLADPSSWLFPAMRAEVDRSLAIQSLEKDYKNFHFLSLPMDGPIWKVQNHDINALKGLLFKSFLSQRDGFAFPSIFGKELDVLEKDLNSILDRVHRLYFKGEPIIKTEDKKAFIMLFYSEVKDYFKAKLEIDFIVSACKDNKDRGNASTNVDMMKNLVILGQENDPVRLREAFISVLAPFVIKNEAILTDRLNLLLNVVNVLAGLSPAEKEAIQKESTNGYGLVAQEIPKEQSSWSQMVGPRQFIRLVDNMKALREKRVIVDQAFQAKLGSDYLKNGSWDLPRLRVQIEKDLPRTDIRIDGARMSSFEEICLRIGIDHTIFNKPIEDLALSKPQREALLFMSMLHQGTALEMIKDAALYLNGNHADLVVSQRRVTPERARVLEIISEARKNEQIAFEVAQKSKEEFRGKIEKYLRSAVQMGFLPERFLPEGNFPYVPVYPTRILATTVGALKLEAYQEAELRHPEAPSDYLIDVSMTTEAGRSAKIAWEFIQ